MRLSSVTNPVAITETIVILLVPVLIRKIKLAVAPAI
jgi:hypothetical protein